MRTILQLIGFGLSTFLLSATLFPNSAVVASTPLTPPVVQAATACNRKQVSKPLALKRLRPALHTMPESKAIARLCDFGY